MRHCRGDRSSVRVVDVYAAAMGEAVVLAAKPAQGCARPEAFSTCKALKNYILVTLFKRL